MSEAERIKKSKVNFLKILREHPNGITNAELSQLGYLRYGGYLGQLYKEGYKITKEHQGEGIHLYTLISEPKEKVLRPSAYEVLSDYIRYNSKTEITAEQIKELCQKAGVCLKVKAGTYQ